MTNDPKDERALEALFETARESVPALDSAFVERLMPSDGDSETVQTSSASGFRLRDWLPALGGLGMATALGVWIGVAIHIDSLLGLELTAPGEAFDLSAFYAGADPGVFFSDETGL